MKKILFLTVGSALCGLAMAVVYLAYAQEGAMEAVETEEQSEEFQVEKPAPRPSETKSAAGVRPADGTAVSETKPGGKLVELQVSGRSTNAVVAAPAEGANTNLISIVLDNVPVQDVVSMFAQISGANIITSGNFTNIFVNASLKSVEWKTALRLALGSVNLALIEDPSGILMVVTSDMYKQKVQQIEETKPLVTKTFAPKYLSAVDLIEQIKLLKLLSPRGTIITSQSKEQDKLNIKSTATGTATLSPNIQNPSITTAIIVSDIKEYVDKVEALVVQLDHREPQVFIEARIIDVNVTYDQKLGVDWSMLDRFGVAASFKNVGWDFSKGKTQNTTTDNRDYQYDKRNNNDGINKRYDVNGQQYEESTTTYEESPPGSGNWISKTVVTPTRTIGDTINRGREITSDKKDNIADTYSSAFKGSVLLSASDVALYLSALRSTGNAKTLSHPVLIVGNKVEASLHVGDQTWKISLKKDTTTIGASPVDRYSEDASPVDLGLKLWLIPEIDLPNDAVRMTLAPEMTVLTDTITTAQGSSYPVTSTRRLSTRVSVPNSQTIVIGGLIENTKSKAEKRVPLLGDIPLLGYLFRHTEDIDEKHNLLIMLTPTILDERKPYTGMEAIAQLTVNDFEQTPLAPIKNVPTNQPFAQMLDTNLVTPSAGLVSAPSAVPVSQPQPVAQPSAAPSQAPAAGAPGQQPSPDSAAE